MPAISVFLLLVCYFQIYSGLMKWVALNKTALKKLRNGNFQTVVSLLYAHYPIFSYYHTNNIAMLYLVHYTRKRLNLEIWI